MSCQTDVFLRSRGLLLRCATSWPTCVTKRKQPASPGQQFQTRHIRDCLVGHFARRVMGWKMPGRASCR